MPAASDAPRRTWLDRALGAVGLQRAIPATGGRGRFGGTRVYAAGAVDRLTLDLFDQTLSGNDELKHDIRRLRGLSRRLVRDTSVGRRFRQLITEQTLGPQGVLLQARVERARGGRNVGLNSQLEWAWYDWGRPGVCTADGLQSWQEFEESVLASLAIDGEAIVRHIRGAANPWGYAVQLIDPDFLDHTYSEDRPNGNKVIMGVEIDPMGRRVAYHLWNKHPSEHPDRRDRVPAREIEHIFRVQRAGAVRGEPWSAPVLLDASMLSAFLEAAVHAARVGASRMAAIERDKDVEPAEGWTPSAIPDEVAPAQMLDLEPGARLNALTWQYPTGELDPFTKVLYRSLASGWGVSYASLSGDLSDVNFSSIRTGLVMERDTWRTIGRFLIDRLHWPVYRAWREMAVAAGRLPARANMTDYDRVHWQSRGFAYVNPVDEVNAHEKALANKLTTRRRILAEQGLDLEEVLEELAEEEALMRELGLDPTTPVTGGGAAAPAAPTPPAESPVRRIA